MSNQTWIQVQEECRNGRSFLPEFFSFLIHPKVFGTEVDFAHVAPPAFQAGFRQVWLLAQISSIGFGKRNH